jgi:hypothetical protein
MDFSCPESLVLQAQAILGLNGGVSVEKEEDKADAATHSHFARRSRFGDVNARDESNY